MAPVDPALQGGVCGERSGQNSDSNPKEGNPAIAFKPDYEMQHAYHFKNKIVLRFQKAPPSAFGISASCLAKGKTQILFKAFFAGAFQNNQFRISSQSELKIPVWQADVRLAVRPVFDLPLPLQKLAGIRTKLTQMVRMIYK